MADSLQHFDFDHWNSLAQRDPAAFFAARQRVIQEFLNSAPPEHLPALLALQKLIDGTRAEAGTPLKAVQQMMGMMTDHLEAMKGQLVLLRGASEELAAKLAKIQD